MIKKNKDEIIRIIKYLFSAGSSFILDNVLFNIFIFFIGPGVISIYICTTLARIISSIYNYFINSRVVFKNKDKKTIIGYFILVVVQMIVSATLVSLIDKYISIATGIIKLVVDIVIFVVNYIIQKEVIFK
ncbi:MAG: GtrA family protein [Bacilli bacterium]|nr:GtrA family protein [Bacilli bacterium]